MKRNGRSSQMKILVIGGTGPTGPYIVNGLLERGHEVIILHTGTHEVEFSEPVEHLHGDPNFKETLEQTLGNRTFDLVIGMYGRNRYLPEVMKGRTPRIITAAASAYADGLPQPVPETAPLKKEPKLLRQIWLTEQIIMEAHNRGDFSATILRYPGVYGPRQTMPMDWSIVKRILDGRKYFILPDSGLSFLTMGYAENTAHAMLLVVDNPEKTAGQIYNVRDGVALTLRQKVDLITSIMNYEWEMVNIPIDLARPSWPYTTRWFDVERLHLLQHNLPDISKLKIDLGYQDIVPVEEGIKRTVEWLIENPPDEKEYETKSGDRFNYAAEDRLIQEFKEFAEKARAIPFEVRYRHSYDHPKEPKE